MEAVAEGILPFDLEGALAFSLPLAWVAEGPAVEGSLQAFLGRGGDGSWSGTTTVMGLGESKEPVKWNKDESSSDEARTLRPEMEEVEFDIADRKTKEEEEEVHY